MIVNYLENGWQIISQRAHGLLAGEICFHWKKENRPERWLETIIATAGHDDVFNEFDSDNKLINENGGPVNFKSRKFEKQKCDELIGYALTKSRYIALLTSRHIRFLYGSSDYKAAKKYADNLQKQESVWKKEIGLNENELIHAYAILEWCDAFSLLICQQLIQPENRKIEISTGPDQQCYQLYSLDEKHLHVDPWPFESEQFEIRYESRTITQLQFKDVSEFRKILLDVTPELHVYQVSKPKN
ncbi:DUF3891 family protein [Dyadobacter sp. NIV53]|uniref:DUF3891 family protein n=1 Tax=Dyadobacter sp. NIV53 TaxID=2861765 RepID=UPI001C868D10|nr:DUF3891 family protein [Dyadobacter sp. NIV53]